MHLRQPKTIPMIASKAPPKQDIMNYYQANVVPRQEGRLAEQVKATPKQESTIPKRVNNTLERKISQAMGD